MRPSASAISRGFRCATRLSELGITDALFARYAADAALVVHDDKGNLLARPPMSRDDIIGVPRAAL